LKQTGITSSPKSFQTALKKKIPEAMPFLSIDPSDG